MKARHHARAEAADASVPRESAWALPAKNHGLADTTFVWEPGWHACPDLETVPLSLTAGMEQQAPSEMSDQAGRNHAWGGQSAGSIKATLASIAGHQLNLLQLYPPQPRSHDHLQARSPGC